MIACVEAPRLNEIATSQFIESKCLRTLYKKQVREKSKQLKENPIHTSYRASIEDGDLMIVVAAGWVDSASIDELTETQIQQCLDDRCKQEITGEQLYLVDPVISNVSMETHMLEASYKSWTPRKEYSIAL